MFIYFELFLIFSLAFFVLRIKPPLQDDRFQSDLPLFIIITGIIFRLTLFPAAPTTSPDAYRYVWEGKIVSCGFNPYQIPPGATQLDKYHSYVWEKVGFKNLTTIYPPFAQVIFLTAYTISGDSLWGLKLIYLLCEIITLIFLLKLLKLKKINPDYIILYAWLPLPVMEYFINAHIDVAGITFLILFLYNLEQNNHKSSAVFYAVSFLTKFYPLMLFPLLIKKLGFKKLFVFGMIFLFTALVFYAPFLTSDWSVKNTLTTYLLRWEFNGSVYNILKMFSNRDIARIVCSISLILAISIISVRYRDFVKGAFGVFLSYVIFAATLYPWYLGWLGALNPMMNFYSIFCLLFTSNFSNFTPLGKVWQEYWRVLVIEYIPFFYLLFIDLRSRYSLKRLNPSSS
jgi:alpha-1,6-mannosyltransferase